MYVVSTGALTSCLSPHVNEASLITPREITTGTGGRRLSIIRPRNVARNGYDQASEITVD